MTANKDLKRRIRTRQAETGESYVAARRAVLAAKPQTKPPFIVDELRDWTDLAYPLRVHCQVSASSALDGVDPTGVLTDLREIVCSSPDDPAMQRMRAVVLDGRHVVLEPPDPRSRAAIQQFLVRARAGIGGIAETGTMLAFAHAGTMLLVSVGWRTPADLPPSIVITRVSNQVESAP
jgi:hypothetical protein